jgi:hypothetical protein
MFRLFVGAIIAFLIFVGVDVSQLLFGEFLLM